jgi:hypothetical protein
MVAMLSAFPGLAMANDGFGFDGVNRFGFADGFNQFGLDNGFLFNNCSDIAGQIFCGFPFDNNNFNNLNDFTNPNGFDSFNNSVDNATGQTIG